MHSLTYIRLEKITQKFHTIMGYKKLQEKIPLRGHHKIITKYGTRAMYVYLNISLLYKDVQDRKPKSKYLPTLE